MKRLRVVYFGTPAFSAHFLQKCALELSDRIEIVTVVTQPDKPVGRKQILTATPVSDIANQHNIPVYKKTLKQNTEIIDILTGLKPDMALVFAYGEIISGELLHVPSRGFWNLHPSLLPLYRGASPVAYPLILGDRETGVTLMKMDEKMDHGPTIAQTKAPISPDELRPDLTVRLTGLAFYLFKTNLENTMESSYKEQLHTEATVTKLFTKDDGYISFQYISAALNNGDSQELPHILRRYIEKYSKTVTHSPAEVIFNLYRGLYDWPGIWTKVNINGEEKRLKITKCSLQNQILAIERVQLEGKNEIDFRTFQKAYNVFSL